MATDETEKRLARDDRDGWKRVSISATNLGVGLGVLGGIATAAGAAPLTVPLGIAALGALGLRWAAEHKLVGADRRVDDPPREDFREATRAPLVLPYRDVFGPTDFERAIAAYTRRTVETVSFECAMVTAHERELGAIRYGATEYQARRAEERRAFRIAAGRSNVELADSARHLADRLSSDVLADSGFEGLLADWSIARILEEAEGRDLLTLATLTFPDQVETFERAGYPRSNLMGAGIVGDDESLLYIAQDLPGELGAAADACAAYGRALLGGEPPEGGQTARLSPPSGPSSGSGGVLGEAPWKFARELTELGRAAAEAIQGLRRRL